MLLSRGASSALHANAYNTLVSLSFRPLVCFMAGHAKWITHMQALYQPYVQTFTAQVLNDLIVTYYKPHAQWHVLTVARSGKCASVQTILHQGQGVFMH